MEKTYMDVEDLEVYQKLCKLHIDVCDLSHQWPPEEKYELGSQARRSSNSAPAQLAEKHSDRHIKNKIEGVNRSRGEAAETIHHLYMAKLKEYINEAIYGSYKNVTRSAYECSTVWKSHWRSICRNATGVGPKNPEP